jgi:hypothetical protein
MSSNPVQPAPLTARQREGVSKFIHGLELQNANRPKFILTTACLHAQHRQSSNWSCADCEANSLACMNNRFPRRFKNRPGFNVVGWFGTVGIFAALRRRAIEGGSYRVVVSLTRTVLWMLSLGIFDKAYAQATAGSTAKHSSVPPDLFTAETPLGTYQGISDQIVMSRTPGSFRTVLVPRGSSKPEWLTIAKY